MRLRLPDFHPIGPVTANPAKLKLGLPRDLFSLATFVASFAALTRAPEFALQPPGGVLMFLGSGARWATSVPLCPAQVNA